MSSILFSGNNNFTACQTCEQNGYLSSYNLCPQGYYASTVFVNTPNGCRAVCATCLPTPTPTPTPSFTPTPTPSDTPFLPLPTPTFY